MKQVDFNFFDDEEKFKGLPRQNIGKFFKGLEKEDRPVSVVIIKQDVPIETTLAASKTRILLEAIEKTEGRSPYDGEVGKFGRIIYSKDTQEELVMWKSKQLLHFGKVTYDKERQRAEFSYKIY